MTAGETALRLTVDGDPVIAIVHRPVRPRPRGLVIVVGGPQYRVGSHRQFVLLARALAVDGTAVLRFDYRGIGDSGGASRDFETISADIRAAIDALCAQVPEVREVALWGLCDAASAILMYAAKDARVTGLVALNPWVRTESGLARSYLRHYYLRRIADREFWQRVVRGEVSIGKAVGSFIGMVVRGLGWRRAPAAAAHTGPATTAVAPFPERMLAGLQAFGGRVLLVLSGDDLTAGEFKALLSDSRSWRRELGGARITRRDLAPANHTFARAEWRDQVARWTSEWLTSW